MAMFAKIAVALMAGTLAMSVLAQPKSPKSDFGKREFESNCASCHGVSGTGNGPFAAQLKKAPANLTVLAKNNGGVFPMARLYEVIDGTADASHGTREMPIWGREYRIRADAYYVDVPYDPEAYVRARILALLEYISRLQEK